MEHGHRFLAVSIALQLQAVFIQPAATVTMTQGIRIVVLKGFFAHEAISKTCHRLQGNQFYPGSLARQDAYSTMSLRATSGDA
jgi:hypothetical protein